MTNFSPDQKSDTAQTFTSTNPWSSPKSRTTLSSRSVLTPEDFFGQLTHNIPAGANFLAKGGKRFSSSARLRTKIMAKSNGPSLLFATEQSDRAVFNSLCTSAGKSEKATRNPGLIPSFFGKGVPEYPGMKVATGWGRSSLYGCGCADFFER